MAHFEIFPDASGDHRYRLKADNGEIVASSEGYKTEAAARRGCADLVTAAHNSTLTTTNGGWGQMHERELDIRAVDS